MSPLPPYYVLVQHAGALLHPHIEYHYADDSPHALLPRTPDEHVLVVDYASPAAPVAHSLTPSLALTGLRVAPAPADDVDAPRNPNMYILESTSVPDEKLDDESPESAHAALALFKQRNAVLRRVLDYADPTMPTFPESQAPLLQPQLADHFTASPPTFASLQ